MTTPTMQTGGPRERRREGGTVVMTGRARRGFVPDQGPGIGAAGGVPGIVTGGGVPDPVPVPVEEEEERGAVQVMVASGTKRSLHSLSSRMCMMARLQAL
jgi:hypothetical protein